MITLAYQPRIARDRFEQAGINAEAQLAHYLTREFGDETRVDLYFGLRLEIGEARGGGARGPDAAQMDVLIVHRHGMAIVESKSVHDEVRINEQKEWARTFEGKVMGMPSPLEQARRQGEALRRMLRANTERLRDRKILGLVQGGFKYCPIELFVAISDKGTILRPSGLKDFMPEVMKADQIAACVRARMEQHRRAGGLIGMLRTPADCTDGDYTLTDAEIERVREFLLERHRG